MWDGTATFLSGQQAPPPRAWSPRWPRPNKAGLSPATCSNSHRASRSDPALPGSGAAHSCPAWRSAAGTPLPSPVPGGRRGLSPEGDGDGRGTFPRPLRTGHTKARGVCTGRDFSHHPEARETWPWRRTVLSMREPARPQKRSFLGPVATSTPSPPGGWALTATAVSTSEPVPSALRPPPSAVGKHRPSTATCCPASKRRLWWDPGCPGKGRRQAQSP